MPGWLQRAYLPEKYWRPVSQTAAADTRSQNARPRRKGKGILPGKTSRRIAPNTRKLQTRIIVRFLRARSVGGRDMVGEGQGLENEKD